MYDLFNYADTAPLGSSDFTSPQAIDINLSSFAVLGNLVKAIVDKFDGFLCVFFGDGRTQPYLCRCLRETNQRLQLPCSDRDAFYSPFLNVSSIAHGNIVFLNLLNGFIADQGVEF